MEFLPARRGLLAAGAVSSIHEAIGIVIVAAFLVLFGWGAVVWIRRRTPGAWYWRLLAFLQVTLLLQLVAGLILLALGHRQPVLHYLYGSVFPIIVLVIAHVLARDMDQEKDSFHVFVAASFILFGLTLRALATGLGWG